MIIVNKPIELIEVKCYKCNATWVMHPAQNMNSDFVTDCSLHSKESELQKNMKDKENAIGE